VSRHTLHLRVNRARILGMLVSCTGFLFGQVPDHNGAPRQAQKTTAVRCCDENWKNCQSTVVRSPILVAPDGKHRAYAEVKAQIVGKLPGDGDMPDCHNQTTVFVSAEGEAFKPAFDYNGEEGADGNGIQLIDWSPDSGTLVADLVVWKYYSEGWAHDVLVYSIVSGETKKQPLNDLFSKVAKQPCMVEAELTGFLSDGRIGVHVLPTDEFEDAPCVGGGMWAIDLSNLELSKVQKDASPKRNGHFEDGP
jgi:hypothetical protein